MLRVARFLQENDDEQINVSDLIDLMNDFMAVSEITAYGHSHMKAKIKEHFGDQIIITELNGRANVVTFRSTAETVLQEFQARQKDHPEQEKQHIIETADKLIKKDIKLVDTSNEHYLKLKRDASTSFLPFSSFFRKDLDRKRCWP